MRVHLELGMHGFCDHMAPKCTARYLFYRTLWLTRTEVRPPEDFTTYYHFVLRFSDEIQNSCAQTQIQLKCCTFIDEQSDIRHLLHHTIFSLSGGYWQEKGNIAQPNGPSIPPGSCTCLTGRLVDVPVILSYENGHRHIPLIERLLPLGHRS